MMMSKGAAMEKITGSHSGRRSNALVRCATYTSIARNARFPMMKISTIVRGFRNESGMRIRCVLNLRQLRHQLVIAVPLHEIGAAHERAVLRRAAVVVPHVEVRVFQR